MRRIFEFVERISDLEMKDCFNPYRDRCDKYDVDSAPTIRRKNLNRILSSLMTAKTVDVWIGRDLGYRGGRRTGLALTDEYNLNLYAAHLGITGLRRATKGPAVKERTAESIYKVLTRIDASVLTWNVFPLHPHEAGNPFSNRQHSRIEAQVGMTFLNELCSLVPVRQLVAIGKDAASWAETLGVPQFHVRHPSYGGQQVFLDQMQGIYGLKAANVSQMELL